MPNLTFPGPFPLIIPVANTSDLPTGTALTGAELVEVEQSGVNVQVPVRSLVATNSFLYLSQYPGVDPTGVADSHTAVQTAINAAALASLTLVWDCPVYCAMGQNWLNSIFIPSNTNIQFLPSGVCITDGIGVPTFYIINATDVVIKDLQLKYTGAFGVGGIAYSGGFFTTVNNSNNVTQHNYLQNLFNANPTTGNNYTGGGNPVWPGPTNSCAIIHIKGACNRIKFFGGRAYVPDGALASSFIPVFCALDAEYNPGTTVTSGTFVSAATVSIPNGVEFRDFTLDGALMGWVGGPGTLKFDTIRSVRYSDLQDPSNLNVGGVGNWFAPPHLFYLNNPLFPLQQNYSNIQDDGVYVGSIVRRSATSGFINSLKMEPANGSTVDGYVCLRPDGFLQTFSNSHTNGSIKNFFAMYNSTSGMNVAGGILTAGSIVGGSAYTTGTYTNVPITGGASGGSGAQATIVVAGGAVTTVTITAAGVNYYLNDVLSASAVSIGGTGSGFTFSPATSNSTPAGSIGVSFPSSTPYTDLVLQGTVIDTAPVPVGFPFGSDSSSAHQNLEIDIRLITQDWPNVSFVSATGNVLANPYNTAYPAFGVGGSNVQVKAKVFFNACTSTTTFRGVFANLSPGSLLSNSIIDIEVVGWRTFTSANIDSLKQRTVFTQGVTPNLHNKVRLIDASNSWEATIENGIEKETWAQAGLFTPAAGATFATTLSFPSSFSIDQIGWQGNTIAGPASVGVGCTGFPNQFVTAAPVNANLVIPGFNYISCPNNPTVVLLTANGSNFTGTGTAFVSLRGIRYSVSG